MLVQALKENDSSITKLNRSNALVKKDLLTSFLKLTMKRKMFKVQKAIIQAKSDREVSDFLSSEDSCDEKIFTQKQPTRDVLQK